MQPDQTTTLRDAVASIDFRRYIGVVLKHKWYVMGFFILIVTLGTLYTLRQPKTYAATATVEIEMQQPEVLTNVQEVYQLGGGWRIEEYLETQFAIIQSRHVAERVVEKLGLDRDYKFLGIENIQDAEILEEVLKNADPASVLQGRISVQGTTQSFLARITVEDTDPALAALIANTVAETYIEQNLDRKLESTHNALQWLNKQARQLAKELEGSETRLNDFKRDNDILSSTMEDRISVTSENFIQLNRGLNEARKRRMELESEWNALKQIDPEGTFEKVSSPALMENDLLQSLIKEHHQLQAKLSELRQEYTDEHDLVKQIAARMGTIRKNAIAEAKRIKKSVRLSFRAASETEAKLQKELTREKDRALNLHDKEVEYNMLVRNRETARRMYELVMQRLKETDLTRMFKTNNIRVVDAAIVPLASVKPKVKLNVLASILIGLLGGLGLAFLMEMLDTSIKSEEDVENIVGVPLLGVIPQVKPGLSEESNRDVVLYSYTNPKSSLAESVRSLRTNIHFLSPDNPVTKMLVTSAGPREGKTTVASSLAISLAQTGKRTLIIDTDLRKPRVHKVFGLSNKVGITNVVVGDTPVEEAIIPTGIPGLDMLPSGPGTPTPAELIGSESFAQMVDKLEGMYTYLLFDSPPVGAVADALIISNLVHAVVLVAKFGETSKERLIFARRSLADVKANLAGAVINDLDVSQKEYGYYYYYYYNRYGYSYSKYGDDREEVSPAKPGGETNRPS